MTKQLDDMWFSKWVLPEQREALQEDARHLKRKKKPELDEQEIEVVNTVLKQSLYAKCQVAITIFDIYSNKEITGTVITFLQQIKQVKVRLSDALEDDEDCIWVNVGDVIKAELKAVYGWGDVEA